jgi:gamma-glutamyltranspeptidase/glutathione hydrolase
MQVAGGPVTLRDPVILQEWFMRRRAFISTLPLAAAGAGPFSSSLPARAQTAADAKPTPGFQPAGAERFERPDVHAGDRPSGASFASRSAALGCSTAAIAANACLGFLEPTSAGMGGDCFAMVWDPKLAQVVSLAGSGRSPKSLTLATVRSRAKNGVIPAHGAISISTPGAVDAWWTLHQRYGRLKWAELFQPAIQLCESGVPVPQIIGFYIKRNMAIFQRPESGVEEIANALHTYAPSGRAPNEGDVFRNPDLAKTYRMVADGGREAFYDGPIAQTIDAYFKRIGGWLSREDLREQHAEWGEPLVTSYRGVDVHAMAANTQGLATLQMLNILETLDLRSMGFQSAASIHAQVEAKRLAYEDRARYYADPHFAKIPIAWLNSKAYAAERAKLIRPDRILTPVHPGHAPSHGDTTYFSVADASGMMVSMIQSNFRGMGSGLVADGLGFMFQDRGELFSLEDGHPNLYQPGKRPFQTIIPGFATKDGQPWLSFGVMGGDMQPQGQAQILIDRIDYGLDVQAAGDSPRWHHEGSSQSMGEDPPGRAAIGGRGTGGHTPRARRPGLADGRLGRRLRPLRVHRAPDGRRRPGLCGRHRDARRRRGAGLLSRRPAGMRQCRHLAGAGLVPVAVAEVAAHVVDHVGDLRIAQIHHLISGQTEWRHAVLAVEHGQCHVLPGHQRRIAGQFGVVPGADCAGASRHVTALTDVRVDLRPLDALQTGPGGEGRVVRRGSDGHADGTECDEATLHVRAPCATAR